MVSFNWSKLTPLNSSEIQSIPSQPGVYRLSYRSADGSVYVFYVGKADLSIQQSLLSHLDKNEKNVCIKSYIENLECFVKYAVIDNLTLRENAAASLFLYFSPKCNVSKPTGKNIEINYN